MVVVEGWMRTLEALQDPECPLTGWFSEDSEGMGLILAYRDDPYPEMGSFVGLQEFWPGELRAGQDGFDIPAVERYIKKRLKGSQPPPVLVVVVRDFHWGDEYIICDGHHRAMAAAILGVTITEIVRKAWKPCLFRARRKSDTGGFNRLPLQIL